MAAAAEAATFTIVLPRRIIISSSLGLRNNLVILFDDGDLPFSNFFNCNLVNEKKAVSEPEKKADRNRKPTIAIYKKFSSTKLFFSLYFFPILFFFNFHNFFLCYRNMIIS